MRTCPRCGTSKEAGSFNRQSAAKDGLQSWCRICKTRYGTPNRTQAQQRDSNLRHNYGIIFQDKEDLWESQERACALCQSSIDLYARTTHVDHDHRTGRVRGILCHRCNLALGGYEIALGLPTLKEYLEDPSA